MSKASAVFTLRLTPRKRFDLISVTDHILERFGDVLHRFSLAAYCSYHTTAGYLDPNLWARLDHKPESLLSFVRSFQRIFPPGANYKHDKLHLRKELTEEERRGEPKNADAHLTFIGSGLTNYATYTNAPAIPVFLVDLDGVNAGKSRCRQTTIIGFDTEHCCGCSQMPVSVSSRSIDSVNLKDRRLGFFEELHHELRKRGVSRGRIDLSLRPEETGAGLTVNEYETLLMRYDLVDVLRNPFRFMAERGKHMLMDPGAILSKAKGYAKYDFVQILNEFLDLAHLRDSLLERLIYRFMALPASHFLRMKRSISLLVLEDESGYGKIVEGTYQSPIMVQWRRARQESRKLSATYFSFD
jgi:thiamine phosphate synthase YjbQ (UPF0047 family)